MDGSEASSSEWETREEVDACLQAAGVSWTRFGHWRHAGIFGPDVDQVPTAYRGSFVLYPPGTCAQIRATEPLFREKDIYEYVGLRLWRQGFLVDEKYWRPRLIAAGRLLDRALPLMGWLVNRFDRDEYKDTLQEHAARQTPRNIILSRPIGRLAAKTELPLFYRVLIDIGTSAFDGFEPPVRDETQTKDQVATVKAFDFGAAQGHVVLGKSLNSIEIMPMAFGDAAKAMRAGSFEAAAKLPAEEIAKAREDALNALEIGRSLYYGGKWVYGDKAFGLRFVAWFADKAPDSVIDALILLTVRLRSIPGAILSSDQIEAMATQARAAREMSDKLKILSRERAFQEVLTPKRIRAAFQDEISLKRFREEMRIAATFHSATRGVCDRE